MARHIGIDLALIGPPPPMGGGPGAPTPSTQPFWKPDARDYADFVHAVGTRYSGHFTPSGASRPLPRINFWSIWNEPNIGSNLATRGDALGVADRGRAEAVPRAPRRGVECAEGNRPRPGPHPHRRARPGRCDQRGEPGLFNAMAPLRFLRALYCVDADYRQLRGTQASERGCPATAAALGGLRSAEPGPVQGPRVRRSSLLVHLAAAQRQDPQRARLRRTGGDADARGDAGSPSAASTARTRSSRSGRPSSDTSPTRPTPSADRHPGARRVLPQLGRVPDAGRTHGWSPSTSSSSPTRPAPRCSPPGWRPRPDSPSRRLTPTGCRSIYR